MYACDFCLCVTSRLHSDTLYSDAPTGSLTDTRKHKAFILAGRPLPAPVFGVFGGGLFWFWFCMSGNFGANTLAWTLKSANGVVAPFTPRFSDDEN